MSKPTFILAPAPHPARQNCIRAIQEAPDGMMVTIREPLRQDWQNNQIQAMIREFSLKAPKILVNGEPVSLAMDDWRHILVARFRHETPRYALYEGTLILLGASSKSLTARECRDFVEFLHAEAAHNGFTLSRVSLDEPVGRMYGTP